MDIQKFTDLSEEEQEKMKQKYLNYIPVSKIAREHGVSRTTLQYHATTHWNPVRESMRAETFGEFMDTKRESFVKMSKTSMSIIKSALEELSNRDVPPTMREAQMAVNVLVELDKITRLDDGAPTEITAEKPLSLEAVKKKIALDPFSKEIEKIEEIAFTEVENEDD